MTLPDAGRWKPRAAAWTALVVGTACWLAGTAAVAQQKPLKPQAQAQQSALRLNDREYFDARGLNVLVFTNQYNGMFFDEKTAGVEIILNGVRLATGGAVRLSPTPEQWDQIPKVVDRKVDKAAKTITCVLRYEAFDFDSRLVVTPDAAGFRVAVYLDKPVPEKLEGRAGLNLEFLPSKYFERTYLADGNPGIFPRYPIGPTETKPGDTKIRQFEGYSTFDDRGRNEYVEAHPVAAGKTLVLAPEDPERRVTIQSLSGELQLLDGRNLAQNGWFIVRSLLQVEGDRESGGMGGPPERHPELDAGPGHRLLAGRLSPRAEESGGHRARRERHAPPDRVPLRGDARRHARPAAGVEGSAMGLVPPVQVRHGGFQCREPPRPVLHPVPAGKERRRSRLARTSTTPSGTRRRTSGSRSRWTT